MKHTYEKYRMISNVWAMLAAASYAAAIFQDQWLWGILFGIFSLNRANRFIDAAFEAKSEDEENE